MRVVTDGTRWSRGLLALGVALAVLAPLATWFGRMPGLGEFDYLIFYRLLFYNDFTNSLAMLAALLLALAVPAMRTLMGRLAAWISLHPVRTCAIVFLGFTAAARAVYQGFPLAMDEYAPLLQAQIFAQGDIAITYPRDLLDRMVIPDFQGWFILVNHQTGQAASAYWPGLALLMTPFALFGGEWLLNPLLGSIGLWLIGDLARQASGRDDACGWAMLAALACPQYTVNALSFYAMPGLLTLNLLFLWLLLRAGWKSALLAGIVGSIALVLHNPVPHTLFAVPVGLWLLADRERRRRLLPLAIGYLPLTAALGLGWPLLTSAMGLRPVGILGTGSGFIDSWIERLGTLFVLPGTAILTARFYAAWKMIIWAAPGLLLTLRPRGSHAIPRMLLAALFLTFIFYFLVPFDQGHGWGYRYIHSAWAAVPIAAGILAAGSDGWGRKLVSAGVAAGLLATPAFMWTTHRTITTSMAMQPPVASQGIAYVFISPRPTLYSIDLVRNYPQEGGRILTMWGASMAEDRALMAKIAPSAKLYSADERGSSWIDTAEPKTRTDR